MPLPVTFICLGEPVPANAMRSIERAMQLRQFKWDTQVGDTSVLCPHLLRPVIQGLSRVCLPGSYEHPRDHPHLRHLLQNRHPVGEGKKRSNFRPLWTRFRPAKTATCLNSGELWSFVGSKVDQLWLWVALCRRTRQIVARTLGDRSLQSANDLRASLPKDYRCRATRSDYWGTFAAAFPRRIYRCCGKEEGKTRHLERWIGTLRAKLSRLVRRAYSFSKCAENHLDAIRLSIITYNLAVQ